MTASLVTLLAFPAFAGEYDIKEMTPAVQRAIQERQARYAQLEPFKQEGVLGEDNQGFVRIVGAGLKPAPPEASALAETENGDRQVIYRAIVDQNGLGSGGMAQVQSIFAEVQRGKARPGEWVQSRTGEWTQK